MDKNIISHEAISSLCLELSMLFHAGVGTGDALTLLAEESDKAYGPMLASMADQVDGGASLSAAMKETGRFPVYVCGLVEVGERAGRTEEALAALASGEATAVLELPEDFVRKVQWGENPPVRIIVDGSRPLESLLTLWVGQSAADLLAASQAGIYAVLERYGQSPPPGLSRDQAVMEALEREGVTPIFEGFVP